MPRPRENPNRPNQPVDRVNPQTEWDLESLAGKNIPYIDRVPASPIKMQKDRKRRIRKIIEMKAKDPTVTAEEIAKATGVTPKTVKRDMSTAVVLASKALPYVPAKDRQLIRDVVNSYSEETKALLGRIKGVVATLEEKETYLDGKLAASYAMLIGELRQTLELGAKISGELKTGTQVNVIVFSSLIKRIIEIIAEETDKETFLRIRERIKLEMQGRKPLGEKGGEVQVEDAEIVNE